MLSLILDNNMTNHSTYLIKKEDTFLFNVTTSYYDETSLIMFYFSQMVDRLDDETIPADLALDYKGLYKVI